MDPYLILELTRDCTELDVRRAYRRLALLYHPDKNDSPDAPTKFREVSEAYEVLSDAHRRAAWDGAHSATGFGGGGDASSFATTQQTFHDPFAVFADFFAHFAAHAAAVDGHTRWRGAPASVFTANPTFGAPPVQPAFAPVAPIAPSPLAMHHMLHQQAVMRGLGLTPGVVASNGIAPTAAGAAQRYQQLQPAFRPPTSGMVTSSQSTSTSQLPDGTVVTKTELVTIANGVRTVKTSIRQQRGNSLALSESISTSPAV